MAQEPKHRPTTTLLPPWQQKIFSSTMAAMGRQLKQSVKVFHSLMLYLLLPAQKEVAHREDPPPPQSRFLCTHPGTKLGEKTERNEAYILLFALHSSTFQSSNTCVHKNLNLMVVPTLVPRMRPNQEWVCFIHTGILNAS